MFKGLFIGTSLSWMDKRIQLDTYMCRFSDHLKYFRCAVDKWRRRISCTNTSVVILNAHLMSWTIVTNKIKDKDVGQKKIKLKDQWFKYTCIYFSRICNTARRALFFLIFPWCMVTNFDLQKLFLLRYSTCSCRTEE